MRSLVDFLRSGRWLCTCSLVDSPVGLGGLIIIIIINKRREGRRRKCGGMYGVGEFKEKREMYLILLCYINVRILKQ